MKLGWLILWGLSQGAWALEPCQPGSRVGSWCQLAISSLRPTQAGIGQLQVDETARKLAGKDAQQLDAYMKKKEIPVVIAPDGGYWLVDRHHLTTALWQTGVREVRVKVIARLQEERHFWSQMQNNHWAWLKDERGQPITPRQLPNRIGTLPDYPYRTLAGLLQDAGYFQKNKQVYFIEFAWASWLGQQMRWLPVTRENLTARLQQAKRLACAPAARDLPGYPGKQCRSKGP